MRVTDDATRVERGRPAFHPQGPRDLTNQDESTKDAIDEATSGCAFILFSYSGAGLRIGRARSGGDAPCADDR